MCVTPSPARPAGVSGKDVAGGYRRRHRNPLRAVAWSGGLSGEPLARRSLGERGHWLPPLRIAPTGCLSFAAGPAVRSFPCAPCAGSSSAGRTSKPLSSFGHHTLFESCAAIATGVGFALKDTVNSSAPGTGL